MGEDASLGSRQLLNVSGEMKDLGGGMLMLQLFANICFVVTGDGIALFDVGLPIDGPRIVKELRSIGDVPVRYVIYGHGHADHAFATRAVLDDAEERGHPRPVIVAHENVPRRFDRYREMLPYHEHINRIQFAIPEGIPAFVQDYIYPDETYRDEMTLELGGLTLELRHACGETDDATWAWIPEKKAALVSDLWVWSCPNIGNPFKVQRYTTGWAQALEAVASRSPEVMLPGHGDPLTGADTVEEACLTVARALRCLRGQVVGMLNRGMWPDEILHSFEWPEEFARSRYLTPIYGHPYFIVQALLRQYHGWYDGNPSHVFPARSGEIAGEVLSLSGGPDSVLKRAVELAGTGRTQLALHLVDFVLQGETEGRVEALELKAELLEALAGAESSFIARNIFLGGARGIRKQLGD